MDTSTFAALGQAGSVDSKAPTLRFLLMRLAAACLLPVIIGAGAMTYWYYGHEKYEVMENMELAARALSGTLDERFLRARLQLDPPPAAIALQPGPLHDMLVRQALPSGWIAWVVDDNGNVVARSSEQAQWQGKKYVWAAPPRGDNGVIDTDAGAVAYARSTWTGWSIVLEAPTQALYRTLHGILLATSIGLALLIAFSLWVVRRVSNRILTSMRMLENDARQAVIGLPVDLPPLAFREADEFAHLLDQAAHEVHASTMALERSERQLRAVLDTAMDAIVVADSNGKIILFNDEAERMFRSSREFMLGQPLEAMMPERFRDAHAQMVKRFSREPGTARAMGRHRLVFGVRSDGEEFPVEASISSARADGDQWMTVIMRDVTRRELDRHKYEENHHAPLRLIRDFDDRA